MKIKREKATTKRKKKDYQTFNSLEGSDVRLPVHIKRTTKKNDNSQFADYKSPSTVFHLKAK